MIIAKDIFRRFPTKYEKLIGDLVAKVKEYSEPESKSAIAWIFGEYAEKIKNCYKIFHENFIENFIEESDNVKL